MIALTHLAHKGSDLAEVAKDVVPPEILPKPGEVHVVGVAGDRLPVQKTSGINLIPYTLWGEIALQVGGDELYKRVENPTPLQRLGKIILIRCLKIEKS